MLIGVGVIALVFSGIIFMNPQQNQTVGEIGDYTAYTKGPDTAKVKIVEYADFQCPACAAAHPAVSQLLADYPNDVQLTFKHFPLSSIHPNALSAAKAAEAAGLQGKFFEMSDLLFQNQSTWSRNSRAEDIFVEYASSLGLDVEKFKTDMNDATIAAKIRSNYAEGVQKQVRGTPTFFVNDTLLTNNGALRSEVERLLTQ